MTKEKYDLVIAEIKRVCDLYLVGIVGTCESEGIYGEITIVDLQDERADEYEERNLFNFADYEPAFPFDFKAAS